MHKCNFFNYFFFPNSSTSHLEKANYEINSFKTEKVFYTLNFFRTSNTFVQVREINLKDINYKHFGKDVWHIL